MNDKSATLLIEQFESALGLGQQAINALAQSFEGDPGGRFKVKAKSASRLTVRILGTTVHFATRLHGTLHSTEIAVFAEHDFSKGPRHILSAPIDANGTLQVGNNTAQVEQCAGLVTVAVLMALRNEGLFFGD